MSVSKSIRFSIDGLYKLTSSYPKNIILSYINVNSITNKLDDLKILVAQAVDILCLSETKLYETFPTAQFVGFKKPYQKTRHIDVTSNSVGLLFYVKSNLPSKLITLHKFPKENQCIPIELNISNKKFVIMSIYRPPRENLKSFLEKLSEGLDIFCQHYENICIIGDFNATSENADMSFLDEQCLANLIKNPTCFKSTVGSTIDLILTTNRHLFQKTHSFETGVSDHHHLICTMLKTTYECFPPKLIHYRNYKDLSQNHLHNKHAPDAAFIQPGDIGSLQTAIVKTINKEAPIKKRMVRGNNKPHVTSMIRKEIMTRSRLKNKANKSGRVEDRKAYKKQRNLVLELNRKAKKEFIKNSISKKCNNRTKTFYVNLFSRKKVPTMTKKFL